MCYLLETVAQCGFRNTLTTRVTGNNSFMACSGFQQSEPTDMKFDVRDYVIGIACHTSQKFKWFLLARISQ